MESQEPHNIDFNYKKFKKKLENPLIHIINIYAFFNVKTHIAVVDLVQ